MAWLDVEGAVADRLAGISGVATANIVVEQPSGLASRLPLINVRRAGGVDEYRQVIPGVVVEVFAASREQAWQVAEDAALRLLGGGGFVARPAAAPPVVVDKVTSVSANTRLAYTDPKIRMVSAIYRVVASRYELV